MNIELVENVDVVRRFDAILNSGEVEQLDDLCTPDMTNHSLGAERPDGLEGTRDYLLTAGAAFRSETWKSSVVVADGEMVVQFGRRQGDFPGGSYFGFRLRPGHYERDVSFMYRLVDGRIAERWAVRDDLGFIRTLGGL